jgi:hypothetical protein
MPDQSTILSLPHIQPSQAQKHVTHNEALRLLDVMVQLSVLDRALTAPPANPALGDRYIVGSSPSGDWAGQGRDIALWNGTAWEFFGALQGWRAYVVAEAAMVVFDGAAWADIGGAVGDQVPLWGVNMTPDATNKLAVKSAASLFSNPSGSHQMAISKGVGADTSSVLFQRNFMSHAEVGLVGDNNLTVKVSPDGTAFTTALRVSKDDGRVALDQPVQLVPMAGDAALVGDGFLWYNSTTGKFRARQSGATVDMITAGGGGGSSFSDAAFALTDDADPTRIAKFAAGTISTGTTRTYDLPNVSGTLALLSGMQTFSGPTTFTSNTLSLGTSSVAGTFGVGIGPVGTGVAKTVNIGTGGLAGSDTTINIGSTTAGAFGATVIASSTVSMPIANVSMLQLGVGGATADASNPVSISAPGVLISHAGAGTELTINKASTSVNAWATFKTAYSTRAQIGLGGSDDLTVRVSADGFIFNTALTAAATTGSITLAAPLILSGQSSDPGGAADGTMWYNSTTGQFKMRTDGQTRVVDRQDSVPWLTPVSGEHVLTTIGGGSGTGGISGAADRCDLFPFLPRNDLDCTGFSINCTAGASGKLAKIVVYDSDNNGRPNVLLYESGTLDLASAGVKTATTTFNLTKGQTYWLGVRHSSTATISTWANSSTPDINGGAPTTSGRKILRRTLIFGSGAPSPWSFDSAEITSSSPPAIWIKL